MRKILIFILALHLCGAIGSSAQNKVKTSIFLAGNTASNPENPETTSFLNKVLEVRQPSAFVFLGNFTKTKEYPEASNKKKEVYFYPKTTFPKQDFLFFCHGAI